jgi:hypothetical protein
MNPIPSPPTPTAARYRFENPAPETLGGDGFTGA